MYPLFLLLLVWQLVVSSGVLPPLALPPPAEVFRTFVRLLTGGSLVAAAATTLGRIVAAFGLALAVGVPLGLIIGRVPVFRAAARPIVAFLFPTPKTALYPAMLILFGLGGASKIALGFSLAVFQVLLATTAAASQIEPRLVWSARNLGTSRFMVFQRVVLPASLPGIMTGARIGLVGAIIGVFLGELIAGADGLGQMMTRSRNLLETPTIYAVLITTSLIGVLLDRILLAVRARLLYWSHEGT